MATIEELREILFGETRRELERRVSRLQTRLTAHCDDVAKIEQQRTTALQAHVSGELAILRGRFDAELAETREAIRAVAREQRDATVRLEERIAKVEEAHVTALREIRQQMLEQSRGFFDELQRVRRELNDALEDEIGTSEIAHDDEHDPAPLTDH